MSGSNNVFPSGQLARLMGENSQRSSALHRQFLQMREQSLRGMQALIAAQMGAVTVPGSRPALFDSRQLDEFGFGQISNCLGPAFARYDQRRIPRIPNGDLKLMSRVTRIDGRAGSFSQPASITVEYDVPPSAWYLRDNAYPEIPISVWMEIALQPCGFLSAYLDTYACVPHEAFYFRNLDGSLRWLAQPADLRGQTIVTQARLLSHIASGETVIQKFAFELSCGGQPLCQGESMFGYFSAESMNSQVGLDGGQAVLPWVRTSAYQSQPGSLWNGSQQASSASSGPYFRLSQGQMNLLDDIFVLPDGGKHGQGYAYASRPVNAGDWFYPFHFYQDPVMPGSLGVEAIVQALQSYALASGLGQGFRSPRFGVPAGQPALAWRYRGQITPKNQVMELEAHIRGVQRGVGSATLLSDASLWVDGLRIYEVKNLAVNIVEG